MRIPIYLYAALLVFITRGLGAAQQSVTSGTLSGRIEDETGAVVSGVTVTATHLETNQQLTTTSDVEGRYRFPYLRTGAYDLKVEAQGFESLTKQLVVLVGQALDMPIKLDVAGITAQVNIGSDVPILETVRTQITETIRPREINELPLNGRNYQDLALLAPGGSPINNRC